VQSNTVIPSHMEAGRDAVRRRFRCRPDERLSWAHTIGIGAQHVVAMFGATLLVPVLTGFPPATKLLFSGVGTVLFLVITGNRLPSYLGSSFSVIAPVTAAVASHGTGSALGGLVAGGVTLIIIGVVLHVVGTRWIDVTLPPVVTGAIIALIGFNSHRLPSRISRRDHSSASSRWCFWWRRSLSSAASSADGRSFWPSSRTMCWH
jgi:hypothetical protein